MFKNQYLSIASHRLLTELKLAFAVYIYVCFAFFSALMDPPVHECSLESEDYSPSDAEKEASDQLEPELQANETYKDSPPILERQMSVTLTISSSYVQDWGWP
jgi:hypothetical protein